MRLSAKTHRTIVCLVKWTPENPSSADRRPLAGNRPKPILYCQIDATRVATVTDASAPKRRWPIGSSRARESRLTFFPKRGKRFPSVVDRPVAVGKAGQLIPKGRPEVAFDIVL